jgi:hypothetical protein
LTNGVYAYIKHFAGNDCETSRQGLYTWMTEQTWRENILRPFEIAVKEGDANAVMTEYSRVGSVWAGGNKALLTDVLRGEWGFTGSVVTDYYGAGDGVFMNVDQGLRAGGDLWLSGDQNMPNSTNAFVDRSSPTALAHMRKAAKNILFTLCNSYYYSNITEGAVLVQAATPPLGFAWWHIWGWLPADILLFGGLFVLLFFAFRPEIKKLLNRGKGEPAAAVAADAPVGGGEAAPAPADTVQAEAPSAPDETKTE